jgi:hypothetical protein
MRLAPAFVPTLQYVEMGGVDQAKSRYGDVLWALLTQSRMNKAILCGHRYPSIADESVQQLRLKLQVNES